jgi:hypothetical protein
MKDSEITIENFENGKFAIENDCTLEILTFLINKVLGTDFGMISGKCKYYSIHNDINKPFKHFIGYDYVSIPVVSAQLLYNKITKTMDKRFPFNLKSEDAQAIINIACQKWKKDLAEKWAKSIVLSEDIKISEEYYKIMRNACDPKQHLLFDTIFGKDTIECPYKEGELIFVKENINSQWLLRYSKGFLNKNNEAVVVGNQKKSGESATFRYHAPAPNVKLPE